MPIGSWNTTATTRYPRLKGALDVDVAVVGGGITGLTAALQLARAGKSIVVLELSTVGAGSTGDSTGHLTACLDSSYEALISHFREDRRESPPNQAWRRSSESWKSTARR